MINFYDFNAYFRAQIFSPCLQKKSIFLSLIIHPNQFKSIFRHLIDPKLSRKLDLNRFEMDLREIWMDFSKSENPSKSI